MWSCISKESWEIVHLVGLYYTHSYEDLPIWTRKNNTLFQDVILYIHYMNSGTFKSGLASINNHYRKHTYTVKCVTHGVGVRFRSLCRCLSRSRLRLRERSLDFSIFFFPRSFSLSLDRLRDRRDLSRRSLSFSLSLLRLRRCDFFSRPILITKHG